MNSILPKIFLCVLFCLSINLVFGSSNVRQTPQIPPFLMNNINLVYKLAGKLSTRHNLIEFAEKYVGTPYRSGGTLPDGFDCSGFTKYVFSQYGIKLAHSSREQALLGTSVKSEDAKPGDLLIFAVNGRVHHVAMVYSNINDDLKMIHSCNSKGVYVESVNATNYWKSRLYSIRRVI